MLRTWLRLAEEYRVNELRVQCEAIRRGLCESATSMQQVSLHFLLA